MGMMWGWLSAAAVRASRLKRSTMPSPMSSRAGASTLIATLRSRARSWARYTVAIKACRAVLYPITHGLPAGNSLPGRRFPILAENRAQRRVALEDRLHVRDRDGRHLAARLERGAADVWQQHRTRRRPRRGWTA